MIDRVALNQAPNSELIHLIGKSNLSTEERVYLALVFAGRDQPSTQIESDLITIADSQNNDVGLLAYCLISRINPTSHRLLHPPILSSDFLDTPLGSWIDHNWDSL